MIGFEQSVWVRLAVGGIFCVAATGLVWVVEHHPDHRDRAVVPAGHEVAKPLRLVVESSYPVACWSVSVLGAAQTAESSDPFRWHGLVSVPSGEEVLVQAAGGSGDGSPHRALRLHLGDAPEHVVWGSGDLAATVAAP